MGLTQKLGTIPLAILTDSSNNVGIGAAANASFKLQVTGTTNLTGALSGTSATFSSSVTSNANEGFIIAPSSGASYINYKIGATSYSLIGIAGAANDIITGSATGDLNIRATNSQKILFSNNNGASASLTIASTGAATFSSSVTAYGPANDWGLSIWGSTTTGQSYGGIIRGGTNSSDVAFKVNNAANTIPYFNIRGDGNVGIGTSSPAVNLDIAAANQILDSNGNFRILTTDSAAINKGGQFTMGGFYSGTSLSTVFGAISARKENGTDGNFLGYMAFATQNGSLQERMRITSGGNVQIGTSAKTEAFSMYQNRGGANLVSLENVSTTGYGISVIINNNSSNNYRFFEGVDNTGSARIAIYTNGDVKNTNNSYGVLSDIKLKENIVDATPKLDKLMKIRVVNYNLIGEELKQIGVIAQEVEQIFAGLVDECIDTKKDAETGEIIDLGTTTKSVKMSVFVPMLIKAIQEQQAQIEELKALINK